MDKITIERETLEMVERMFCGLLDRHWREEYVLRREAEEAVAAERERIRVLRKALDRIASWDEGPVVTGVFDEPHAAMVARAALKQTNDR
jgi:hypothetical protein